MANLTITTVTPIAIRDCITAPAGEAITIGQYCRYNTSSGKLELGNASSSGEAKHGGIALKTVAVGETLTAMVDGDLDVGNALSSLAYNADVYLSDTDGALADGAGTVSKIIGRVQAIWTGATPDKYLRVEVD